MKKRLLSLLLLSLPITAMAAKLPVVASFSIVGDMTREIGGERVDVVSLVGPDQDAHVFQPAPADVKRLSASRLFVTNGLGLEGWMGRLTKASGYKG
jgi:zinc/manganese transport system substrate-binding protein